MKKQKSPKVTHKLRTLVSVLLVLNLLALALVVIVLILIKSTNIPTKFKPRPYPVTFSYFSSRPDLISTSKALLVYDANAQVPILSKNQSLRFSPASTAKIMTALVALDHYDPDDVLVYTKPAGGADLAKMGLLVGEKMTVRNLLYGLLLPSGADAAQALSDNYPDGTSAFVEEMNNKALEIGLSNTKFVDPIGLSDKNYTTAYDLSRLGAYALENPLFADIVKTREITVTNIDGTVSHKISNLNELLSIPGVNGIKTGFTNEAEGVLVTSFYHNGGKYIIVVLRSQDRFYDTRAIIQGIIADLKNASFNP